MLSIYIYSVCSLIKQYVLADDEGKNLIYWNGGELHVPYYHVSQALSLMMMRMVMMMMMMMIMTMIMMIMMIMMMIIMKWWGVPCLLLPSQSGSLSLPTHQDFDETAVCSAHSCLVEKYKTRVPQWKNDFNTFSAYNSQCIMIFWILQQCWCMLVVLSGYPAYISVGYWWF